MDYCTIRYTAKGAPPHLAGALTVKTKTYRVGEAVEVPASVAGLVVRCAPAGSVEVLKGTPVDEPLRQLRLSDIRRQVLAPSPPDPAVALADVPKLSAQAKRLVTGSSAELVKAIEAGDLDAELPAVAMACTLLGHAAAGKAAARRRS